MLRLMPRPLQFAFQSAGPQPARSLSGRLCRDASSSLPPSPDVGKFIRGAAFPTARAGLRRPQMRSAAECSRPAALFRPSDGFSARPGNVAAPCGGVHSGSGNEPPARSLSGRLCRDASSSRPPSPDVGEFIRGAAFPIARAGLRRPQMRSAAECSRPAALFRPPDGLSARLGNVAAPCGGVHSGSGNEPPARSLSGRLCRDASSSRPPSPDVGKFIRGAAFPIARAGLRRPLMRSAVECSRPAALFRAPDGLSARPGMSPPRAAGGIPAPATNRPRGACPVGFAGTHRLLSRLLRMSENSSGAPPFRPPVRDCGVRRCGPRPSFARPTDFRHAPAMSPPRAAGCIPAPATNRPRGACPVGFAGTHRLLSRLLRMSENSSGAPPFRSPVRDCGVRRCAPRPSFARPTDFRHAPACRRPVRRGGAFRLRQRTARAAQPRRSDAPGRRSCDRTALRKPPPRPDASRSPEARSSHGRSPPLSPESCGTPAPCGCSPVRKRLRTKHRGAV